MQKLHSTQNYIKKIFVLLLMVGVCLSPMQVRAVTSVQSYQPQTVQEMIAYLYGVISQLQALLDAQTGTDSTDQIGVVRPGSLSNQIDISTLTVTNLRDDQVLLRGELDLERERYATVWFEYGSRSTSLTKRTSKERLYRTDGVEQVFTARLTRLDEGERYYYRAVGEDTDGRRAYGSVRNFVTDDVGSRTGYDEFMISVDDTTIDAGDTVRVRWQVPDSEAGSSNWIGLYERGASNRSYISFRYLDRDTDGTVDFKINDEGVYEFRLFLDNSYDDEITSSRVVVD